MQSVKYFAPVFVVMLVYPFYFFRKLILPVGGTRVVLVIGPFIQESRECFVENCSIIGRKVAGWIWEYGENKTFKDHLVPHGNTCFKYRIWWFQYDLS